MSYSGFQTRQQETFYNKLLEKAMTMMAEKLLVYLQNSNNTLPVLAEGIAQSQGSANGPSDEMMKFFKHIRKIYKYLSTLDKQKYNYPKFGDSLEPLSRHIKETVSDTSETMSTLTSNISVFRNQAGVTAGAATTENLNNSLLGLTGGQNELGEIVITGETKPAVQSIRKDQKSSSLSKQQKLSQILNPPLSSTQSGLSSVQFQKTPKSISHPSRANRSIQNHHVKKHSNQVTTSQDLKSSSRHLNPLGTPTGARREAMQSQPNKQGSNQDIRALNLYTNVPPHQPRKSGGHKKGSKKRHAPAPQQSSPRAPPGNIFEHRIPEQEEEDRALSGHESSKRNQRESGVSSKVNSYALVQNPYGQPTIFDSRENTNQGSKGEPTMEPSHEDITQILPRPSSNEKSRTGPAGLINKRGTEVSDPAMIAAHTDDALTDSVSAQIEVMQKAQPPDSADGNQKTRQNYKDMMKPGQTFKSDFLPAHERKQADAKVMQSSQSFQIGKSVDKNPQKVYKEQELGELKKHNTTNVSFTSKKGKQGLQNSLNNLASINPAYQNSYANILPYEATNAQAFKDGPLFLSSQTQQLQSLNPNKRFASQPRAGFQNQQLQVKPARRKRKRNANNLISGLPSLPQSKITKKTTQWSNTLAGRFGLSNVPSSSINEIMTQPQAFTQGDSTLNLQPSMIPPLKHKLGKVTHRNKSRGRASSALSSASKKSGRSISSASQRSFKIASKRKGNQIINHAFRGGNQYYSKGMTQQAPIAIYSDRMDQTGIVRPSKYIKNVLNIPSYLRDKTGLTQNFPMGIDTAGSHPHGSLSINQHSIEDSLLQTESQLQITEPAGGSMQQQFENKKTRKTSARYQSPDIDPSKEALLDEGLLNNLANQIGRDQQMTQDLKESKRVGQNNSIAAVGQETKKYQSVVGHASNIGVPSPDVKIPEKKTTIEQGPFTSREHQGSPASRMGLTRWEQGAVPNNVGQVQSHDNPQASSKQQPKDKKVPPKTVATNEKKFIY